MTRRLWRQRHLGYLQAMKILALAAAFAVPILACAATTGPVALGDNAGKFGDWTAATYGSGAAKACYAFTTASSSSAKLPARGAVMLTVTERKTAKDEVTLSAGFTYPAKGSVMLAVGSNSFTFYTKGGTAFTSAGSSAIAAFQAGSAATAKSSTPGSGTVTDNFSLTGFSSAYGAISAACK